MAPFYVFPCGHAFHANCLIAHVTRCSSQAQAERILDLQKQLSLIDRKAAKDNGASVNGEFIMSVTPVDKLRSQLDDAVASECPFCGDMMIKEIHNHSFSLKSPKKRLHGRSNHNQSLRRSCL
ncbi:hypothetical protein PR202_gb28654 [Eleusine coracana subsp. coracana]|uniref:Pep3/Vps18 RING C-terminal domain-containing protein n=1 Tax=Eleusine coracana subsp. coracana TaxID=191504 RepID=A0AAV5FXI4_ELECO|nr:hypothetical protein PR202_gb28654 [Eleusine coracana subsp. coracana]